LFGLEFVREDLTRLGGDPLTLYPILAALETEVDVWDALVGPALDPLPMDHGV